MRGDAEAPDADETEVDAGGEDRDPDMHNKAYRFDEQDECGEYGDDDVVFCDPGALNIVLIVLLVTSSVEQETVPACTTRFPDIPRIPHQRI